MDLPTKRKSSVKRPAQNPKKRSNVELNVKISKPSLKPAYLKKELWIEILDYLDSVSYFCVISQVNSFFNSLIKNCKNYRTSLKLRLDLDTIKKKNQLTSR